MQSALQAHPMAACQRNMQRSHEVDARYAKSARAIANVTRYLFTIGLYPSAISLAFIASASCRVANGPT